MQSYQSPGEALMTTFCKDNNTGPVLMHVSIEISGKTCRDGPEEAATLFHVHLTVALGYQVEGPEKIEIYSKSSAN